MNKSSFEGICRASQLNRKQLLLCCLVIFLCALSVRLLVWRDHGTLAMVHHQTMTELFYRPMAEPLIRGDVKTFLTGPNPPNDATVIGHPPGYPIIFAIFNRLFSSPKTALQLFQLTVDGVAIVLVFLIAVEFFPSILGLLAALFLAIAPHISFYSLLLIPDALLVTPVLAALLILIKAYRRPTLTKIVACGALIGLSCWLRANLLFLAPFLACFVLATFRERRLRYAGLLAASAILVISPITLRNYLVFGHFVPISLGSGMVLTEGIAEYDLENRFGFHAADVDVIHDEARKYNRPDYATGLWNVDGIEREKRRVSEGMAVIKAHPLWYLSTAARRAKSALGPDPWLPEITILPAPHLDHSDVEKPDAQLAWSQSPAQFLSSRPETMIGLVSSLDESHQYLHFKSPGLVYPKLARSAEISVEPETAYKMTIPVKTEQGRIILSVTDSDRNVLATMITPDPVQVNKSTAQPETEVVIPFSTGRINKVSLVITGVATPVWRFGTINLYRVGKSSTSPSVPFRWILYGAQKTISSIELAPFALIGILILLLARRWRESLLLLAIPVYFITFGSLVHMEHRYIIPIHYLLAIVAIAPIYWVGRAFREHIGKTQVMMNYLETIQFSVKSIGSCFPRPRKEREGDSYAK